MKCYPPCPCSMKIILVINVCLHAPGHLLRMISFQRRGGCVYLMILFQRFYVLVFRYNIIPSNFGFALAYCFSVCSLRDRGCMFNSTCMSAHVFHDFELLSAIQFLIVP